MECTDKRIMKSWHLVSFDGCLFFVVLFARFILSYKQFNFIITSSSSPLPFCPLNAQLPSRVAGCATPAADGQRRRVSPSSPLQNCIAITNNHPRFNPTQFPPSATLFSPPNDSQYTHSTIKWAADMEHHTVQRHH
jgi:hypothetical protein